MEGFLEIISGKFFGLFCHQDPSLLLQVDGKDILLCPRCAGLHIGFFVSLFVFSIEKKKRIKFSGLFSKYLCLIGILIIASEWLLAHYSIIPSTFYSRMITGLIAGTSFSILTLLYRRNYTNKVENGNSFNSVSVTGIYCLSLLVGLIFLQITSWAILTLALMLIFLINLTFVLHSILLRFILLKTTKT